MMSELVRTWLLVGVSFLLGLCFERLRGTALVNLRLRRLETDVDAWVTCMQHGIVRVDGVVGRLDRLEKQVLAMSGLGTAEKRLQ